MSMGRAPSIPYRAISHEEKAHIENAKTGLNIGWISLLVAIAIILIVLALAYLNG